MPTKGKNSEMKDEEEMIKKRIGRHSYIHHYSHDKKLSTTKLKIAISLMLERVCFLIWQEEKENPDLTITESSSTDTERRGFDSLGSTSLISRTFFWTKTDYKRKMSKRMIRREKLTSDEEKRRRNQETGP